MTRCVPERFARKRCLRGVVRDKQVFTSIRIAKLTTDGSHDDQRNEVTRMIEQFDNAYEALGFANAEAMKEKARLAHALALAINGQKLPLQEAAVRLGMAEADLNFLLHGQFRNLGISEIQLLLERMNVK
jgi:predicted XRE-type DNA-binding protein